MNPTSTGAYDARKWESPKKEKSNSANAPEKRVDSIPYTPAPELVMWRKTAAPPGAQTPQEPLEISRKNQYWNPMFPDVLLPVLQKITSRTMDRFLSGRPLEPSDVGDASLVGLRILYPSIELPSIDCLLKIDPEKYKQHHDWRAIKYKTQQEHLSMIRAEANIKDSIQLEPACVALLGAEHFREHMSAEEYYRNLKTCTYAFLITQTGTYMPVKQELAEALMVHPVLMHTDNDRVRTLIFERVLLKRKYEIQGRSKAFFLPTFPFWVTPRWFEEWLAKNGSLKDRIHGKPEQHKPMDSDTQELLSSAEHAEDNSSSSSQSAEDLQQQQRRTVRSSPDTMSNMNEEDDRLNEDSYSDEDDEDEGEDEQYEKESRNSTPVNAHKHSAAVARGDDEDADGSSSDSSGVTSDDDDGSSGSESESEHEQQQQQPQQKQRSLSAADVSGLKALATDISSVVKPGTFASGRAAATASTQKPVSKTPAVKQPVEDDDDEKPLPKPVKAQQQSSVRTPESGKNAGQAVSGGSAKKTPAEPIPKFQKKSKPTGNLLDDDSDEFDENADESVVVSNSGSGASTANETQQHDSVAGSVVRAGYLPLGAGKRLIDFANKKHDKQQKRKDSRSSGKSKSSAERSVAEAATTESTKQAPAAGVVKKTATATVSGPKIYLEVLGPDHLLEFEAQPESVKRPNSNKGPVDPAMRKAYNDYTKALHQWKDRAEAAVIAERKRIKKTDRASYKANKKYIELNSKVRGIVVRKIDQPTVADGADESDTVEQAPAPSTPAVKSAGSTAGAKRKAPDTPESEPPSKGQKVKTEDGASDSAAAASSTSAVRTPNVKSERKRNQPVAAADTQASLPPWVQPWRDVYDMVDGALIGNVANSRKFAVNHPDAYKQNYATYTLSLNRSDAANVIGDIVMFAAANADRIIAEHTHAPVATVEKGSRLRTMAGVLHNTVADILGLPRVMVPGAEEVKTEVEMEDLM